MQCFDGRVQVDLFAIKQNRARVRPVQSGQYFHQGALARAVLADQRYDFAASSLNGDVV